VNIPLDKKIACITGTVWTHGRKAPRRMLVREGFIRPIWFTTGRTISDADFEAISTASYHRARAQSEVLAHTDYGGFFSGIMEKDFEDAAIGARCGVLAVGFPEVVAQIARALPQTVVFALKDERMELSDHLSDAASTGQLHRIDVDILETGAWDRVHERMRQVLGLPSTPARI